MDKTVKKLLDQIKTIEQRLFDLERTDEGFFKRISQDLTYSGAVFYEEGTDKDAKD